ncbi:flagellar motor switch protein FliG [bacterium NHP-B]|nr:flagellar motor switch protein FliG [bacterium NHP-B]
MVSRIINNNLRFNKDKAAALMLSLYGDAQKAVFGQMENRELWTLTPAMSNLGILDPTVVKNVLTDFLHLMHEGSMVSGNFSGTKKLLESMFGKDRMKQVLDGVESDEEGIWEQLSTVNENMLANFLKKEDIQTASVILARLTSARAAHILKMFDEDTSMDVIVRILKATPVKVAVLSEIQAFIKSEFMEEFKKGGTNAFDPHRVVAEILNAFDQVTGDRVMEFLEKKIPESAARVRALMFTFEDMLRIDSADIQKVISAVDKSELALSLKKVPMKVREHFFSNMSERAAKFLQEDIDGLGAVRVSDMEKAQRSIISVVKQMQKDGDIVIADAGSDDAMIA